ncbi:MAG TPA: DUF3578 domain-containing protein [Chitinophagaceae bacterium]|nr:DUF3578 domain-containing protein [Chitinophagaceae bacterium]
MPIPKNIQKEHLLAAIEKIDIEGAPADKRAIYEVIHKDRAYPPKLMVAYANLFANGKPLSLTSFQTGKGSQCFTLLEQNGFQITRKNKDFFPTLLKFLQQANGPQANLKKKDYTGPFNGLAVEASFGNGNAARIPWIAFLRKGQEVQGGIYPVYLYYKQHGVLILAYGVSETRSPKIEWDVKKQKVEDFFRTNFLDKPDRYGSSLVFTSYNIDVTKSDFGLDHSTINNDILELTDIYNSLDFSQVLIETSNKPRNSGKEEPFNHQSFIDDLKKAQLNFTDDHILRFIYSICTKPFVILTGLSGSGKTKLAQTFAQWLCWGKEQICIVPVGADWTSREPLFGFPNALEKEHYVFPESGVLGLLLRACANPRLPYFLILDEMNLSHVERYFADFLSAMESGDEICLHPGDKDWKSNQELLVPPSISLPPNLFIIGTVNVDETTYMFSPKVLDRANVIEFRVSRAEMEGYLQSLNKSGNPDRIDAAGAKMGTDFVKIASSNVDANVNEQINKVLLSFFDALKTARAEFGYRSVAEIIRFARIAKERVSIWDVNKIIDIAIMQKLLPKLHGSRRKLEWALESLAQLCIEGKIQIKELLIPTKKTEENNIKIKYPLSFDKIKRLYQRLIENSFTSYAED